MAAPRRSKRIQALHQPDEAPRGITESPEALNKDHTDKRRKTSGSQSGILEGHAPEEHPDGDAPKDITQKEETRVIDPAVRRAEEGEQWIEKQEEELGESVRKITESKEYLHRMLALDRYDSDAVRYWKRLSGSIVSLVLQMDLRGITWDSLDESVQQKFISFAPNVEELFDVYGMPRLVFQRWIWEIIDESFFSKKSKDIIWTLPYWETQAAMERYLQEHNFPYGNGVASYKFPHWRHTTMEFYMALEDSPKKHRRIDPACVVPILSKALGRYFPEKRGGTLLIVLEHLEDAVATMEFYFDANLTFFSIVFHHPTTQQPCGFLCEPELEGIEGQAMDEIEVSDREVEPVDFVAEPMLLCRGHIHGYDYHVKTAESPMKVCLAWLQDPERPKLSEMTRGGREQENKETDKDKEYQEDQKDKEADNSKQTDEKVDKEKKEQKEEKEEEEKEKKERQKGEEKGEERGKEEQGKKKKNNRNRNKNRKRNKGKR